MLPDCKGGPGNAPVESTCNLMKLIQPTIDMARRQNHVLGLRQYRCFLVWQRRNSRQRFEEIKRIELMPVMMETVTSSYTTPVGLELGPAGLHAEGGLRLSEVSPAQVSEYDLLGKLDGRDLTRDEEFFYEVMHNPWCANDQQTRLQRYTLKGIPFHNAEKFCWEIELTDQELPRLPEGSRPDRDATHTHPNVPRKDVLKM